MYSTLRDYSICVILLISGHAAFSQPHAPDIFYRVAWIPPEGCECEAPYAVAMNDAGQVCGNLHRYNLGRASLWDPTVGLIDLGSLPQCTVGGAHPTAMNQHGHVVGWATFCDSGTRGWIWTGQEMSPVPQESAGFSTSAAYGINRFDEVVGSASLGNIGVAFRWSGDVIFNLHPQGASGSWAHSINDGGWVAGYFSLSGSGITACVWNPNNELIPIGPGSATAMTISNAVPFQVVGFNGSDGFVWSQQTGIQILPRLNGAAVYPRAINDHGVVVGNAGFRPFVWDGTGGMRALNPLVEPCGAYPGFGVYGAADVNNRDQILGYPEFEGSPAFLLTPTLRGDLDEDDDVDIRDLTMLLSHFGMTSGAYYWMGELTCDGRVNLDDLLILLANFGERLANVTP